MTSSSSSSSSFLRERYINKSKLDTTNKEINSKEIISNDANDKSSILHTAPSPSPPMPPCCSGLNLSGEDLLDPVYVKRLRDAEKTCRRWGYLWNHQECNPVLRRRHIHSGYLDLYTASCPNSVLYSLCSVHNETGNIYTHLLPGLACLLYLIVEFAQIIFTYDHQSTTFGLNTFLLHSMVISMVGCFICSSIYHIGRVAWPHLFPYLFQLDLVGIWCLVTGSFVCGIYVGYECHPFFQSFYLLLFGIALFSIIPLWFIFPHKFPWRVRRTVMVLTIASGCIPCVHWLFFVTWHEITTFAQGTLGMFGLYALGFLFYHYKIPERFAPGKFDIWLHSHQFWHLFVTAAAVTWWWSLDQYVSWRRTADGSCKM